MSGKQPVSTLPLLSPGLGNWWTPPPIQIDWLRSVAEPVAKKRTVVVIRHAPYGNSMARASVDLALALGAFEQDFDLLFMGEGVLQLLPHQDAGAIGLKNIGRALSSLPLVDMDSVYADARALACYGLNEQELIIPAVPVEGESLHRLLCDCDHLLGC